MFQAITNILRHTRKVAFISLEVYLWYGMRIRCYHKQLLFSHTMGYLIISSFQKVDSYMLHGLIKFYQIAIEISPLLAKLVLIYWCNFYRSVMVALSEFGIFLLCGNNIWSIFLDPIFLFVAKLLSQIGEHGNELDLLLHGVCSLLLGICIADNDGSVPQRTKYTAFFDFARNG